MGCLDWAWVESSVEVQGNKYLGDIRGVKPGHTTRVLYQVMGEWLAMMVRLMCSYYMTTNR